MPALSLAPVKPQPMSRFGHVRAFLFIFVLFAPLLFINFLQALALPLRFIAPIQERRWNTLMASIYWGYIAWMIEHANNIQIDLRGDQLDPLENSILICNHQSAFDTLLIIVWARRARRVGTLRFFAKDVLKYVPGPGWGMYLLDCLFLKRSWEEDAINIQATLNRFKKSPIPYCWVIFPEGTRRTPEKLKLSQAKARERQRPQFEHVLNPHPRGFATFARGLDTHMDSVMDMTIVYPDGTPSVWGLMMGASPRVQIHVRRFRRQDLPAEQLAQWLEQRFEDKERVLASAAADAQK